MMVDHDHILVDADGTVFDFTHTDTTYIFVVVDSADQNLRRSLRISFRSRNVV